MACASAWTCSRGAAALEHLHEAIQSGRRGVPERPRDIRVPARWQDGPSLPGLRRPD